jgi:hypothetical protein
MKNIKDILEEIKAGTSIEDIVNMLKISGGIVRSEKPAIASEDEYAELLDKNFSRRIGNVEELDDLDEPFWAYENFFPNNEYSNKSVEGGAWIKVKTEHGYNVYYAKRTKKQFNKTNIQRKFNKQTKQVEKLLNTAQMTMDNKEALATLDKGQAKIDDNNSLSLELMRAEMLEQLGLEPYCVKYRVSKSKWKTATPIEYELVNDIEAYVQVVTEMGKSEAVTYKTIFSAVDEDVIFYLQSRGISRDSAIMLSKLKDCYFICNVGKIFEMAMQPMEETA